MKIKTPFPSACIHSKWIYEKNTTLIQALNPSTLSIVAKTQSSGKAIVCKAVESARKSFNPWRNLDASVRIEIVKSLQRVFTKNMTFLSEIISLETGKTRVEADSEVKSLVSKIDLSIEAFLEKEIRNKRHPVNQLQSKPLGVCGILGPFNFPMHLVNTHLIPAIISGNTVVFKPSELTPLCGHHYMHMITQSDIPSGVINMIQGNSVTGSCLSQHADINALFFTGSSGAGKILSQQFAATPEKMLALEMGGNNPIVVHPPCDMTPASKTILLSAFQTSGQRCTSARRLIIVKSKETELLLQNLVSLSKKLIIAAPSDTPPPFMGPLIRDNPRQNILRLQKHLVQKGGRLLLEAKPVENKVGFFLTPGIMDMTYATWDTDEEFFGPFLKVYRVKNFKNALTLANNTQYGLAASLLSQDESLYRMFLHHIESGIVNWNTTTIGASGKLPFGGVRRSGNFRPGGYVSVDYCTYPTATIRNPHLNEPEIPGLMLN